MIEVIYVYHPLLEISMVQTNTIMSTLTIILRHYIEQRTV